MDRKLLNHLKTEEKQMLRTFHITGSNNKATHQGAEDAQLNISECNNGEKVMIGIDTGEQYTQIALNYQQFEELCGLRCTLELSELKPEEQDTVESKQLVLQVA